MKNCKCRKNATSANTKKEVNLCVDLTTVTKGTFHQLQKRFGTLYRKGAYWFKFTEMGLDHSNEHPWERRETLAKSVNGRISANGHGVFVGLYFKESELEDGRDLVEQILDQTETMCVKLLRKDVKSIIGELMAKKPEEAAE